MGVVLLINVGLLPAPCKIRDFVMESPPFHEKCPDGMATVSPGLAKATADCTSVKFSVAALTVFANALLQSYVKFWKF